MGIALVGYLVFPTAPPRFLPELGFRDSVAEFTGVGAQTSNLLVNPYAAVPSMHVAFALMLAVPMARMSRHAAVRALWGAYPALVTFTVVATANHWWLDAVLGARDRGARGDRRAGPAGPRAPGRLGVGTRTARRPRVSGPWQRALGSAADVDATDREAHARPRQRRHVLRGRPPEADRVAADAERDLAHGLRPVRRRRRPGLAGPPVLGRPRLRRRLGVRHARRPLLAHVGQGHAVRRLPGLDPRPDRGGRRARRRRRAVLAGRQRPRGGRRRDRRAGVADGLLHPRAGRGAGRRVQGRHRRPRGAGRHPLGRPAAHQLRARRARDRGLRARRAVGRDGAPAHLPRPLAARARPQAPCNAPAAAAY